jgi:hypothetical protein
MTDQRHPPRRTPISPTKVVGSILAMGVIRLIERQKGLDSLTEQRVSTGVPTTKENSRD